MHTLGRGFSIGLGPRLFMLGHRQINAARPSQTADSLLCLSRSALGALRTQNSHVKLILFIINYNQKLLAQLSTFPSLTRCSPLGTKTMQAVLGIHLS